MRRIIALSIVAGLAAVPARAWVKQSNFKLNRVTAEFDLCSKDSSVKKRFRYQNTCLGYYCSNEDFASFLDKAEAELKTAAVPDAPAVVDKNREGEATILSSVGCTGFYCDSASYTNKIESSSHKYCTDKMIYGDAANDTAESARVNTSMLLGHVKTKSETVHKLKPNSA